MAMAFAYPEQQQGKKRTSALSAEVTLASADYAKPAKS
jgi:hypothetical protein